MLVEGLVLDNTYQIVSKVGSGGTGDVYLAYHLRLEKYVVVKKIKDNFVGKVNVRAEVDILKRLKHTYLPQVYDFVQMGTTVYTVMDYIEGNDLDEYINSGYVFDEATLIKWLNQLCEVLDYLHSQYPPIIHSDIKPGNIMITAEGNVCLIDFNISLDGDDVSQISGISLPYASPEQYEKASLFVSRMDHSHIILDGRSDMYSLAASFYYLMTGTPPNNPYDYTLPLSKWDLPYSEGLIYIIDKAMSYDINSRFVDMHEMCKSVKTMYKHTRSYKVYIVGNIMASVLYLVAMSFGIWCFMHGAALKVSEKYDKVTDEFFKNYQNGNYEMAIDEGNSILNNGDFEKILNNNKKEKIQILHTIGECFFVDEDFESALYYYEEAANNIKNLKEYSDYYRDYIIALVRCGYIEDAQSLISELNEDDITSNDISVVEAEILIYKGEYKKGLNKIDEVLKNNINENTKFHLLVLAADASKELGECSKQIDYLKKAEDIDNNISVLRKLGNAYMMIVSNEKLSSSDSDKYIRKAEECYKAISEKNYSSLNDGINLSICYRAAGKYRESIQVLKELEKENNDYRIYMHLAFAYDKKEDVQNAKTYTKKAMDSYNKTPENNRESSGSDNIQSLNQLKEKYY